MTDCPSDAVLLDVHLDESGADEMRHVAGCPRCARRLALLRADLAEIDAILATTDPPRRRARLSLALRLAPLAAVALVAVLLSLHDSAPGPTPAPGNAEAVAFLADVSAALAPPNPLAGVERERDPFPSGVELVLDARSTCALDDPFMGTGCQDGVQLPAEEW
jgi:hypothetical protein